MKITNAPDEITRLSSIEAVEQILAVLQNLKNGADKMKVLTAVATLDGSFWVAET